MDVWSVLCGGAVLCIVATSLDSTHWMPLATPIRTTKNILDVAKCPQVGGGHSHSPLKITITLKRNKTRKPNEEWESHILGPELIGPVLLSAWVFRILTPSASPKQTFSALYKYVPKSTHTPRHMCEKAHTDTVQGNSHTGPHSRLWRNGWKNADLSSGDSSAWTRTIFCTCNKGDEPHVREMQPAPMGASCLTPLVGSSMVLAVRLNPWCLPPLEGWWCASSLVSTWVLVSWLCRLLKLFGPNT